MSSLKTFRSSHFKSYDGTNVRCSPSPVISWKHKADRHCVVADVVEIGNFSSVEGHINSAECN